MNRIAIGVVGAAFVFFSSLLQAQVPQIINYQGRVVVGTTNFDGNGQFKFALVDAAGTTTFWSNDSTSAAGSEPTDAVSLTVSKGLYSVLLGDTSIANMSAGIPTNVFGNSDVRLRVWFDDGTHGSQLLTPDQRIAAVGYAMMAGTVPDGTITGTKIAPATITSSNIASGAIGPDQIAGNAVGATQLADGSIGADKIASAQVVKNLNGLTDSVSLAAGSNISITPSGNTLTIASTGGGGGGSVSHDSTLTGNGTGGSPLGLAVPLSYGGSSSNPLWYLTNSGSGPGLRGDSVSGIGVLGSSTNSFGVGGSSTNSVGVEAVSANSYAVYAASTNSYGVFGSSSGSGYAGVYGANNNGDGVVGASNSLTGAGVTGTNTGGGYAGYFNGKVYASGNVGIGTTSPANKLTVQASGYGFEHTDGTVRLGTYVDSTAGWLGTINDFPLNFFVNNGQPTMTISTTVGAVGNVGIGTNAPLTGKLEVHSSGASYGIFSNSTNGRLGVVGWSDTNTGVWGYSGSGDGVFGSSQTGVGVRGRTFGSGSNAYAGFFEGPVWVAGTLTKLGGSFKIDHPLDPENKYLYHSFVESPDMKNIYDGNVITDANGDATVTMPEWFEALNRDFRYQLTVIGQFAQAIVSSEIKDRSFGIKTDKPKVKVSWQVTGIRQDAWANAHRIPVEEEKPPKERGYYLYPEGFGQPAEKRFEPDSGAKPKDASAVSK